MRLAQIGIGFYWGLLITIFVVMLLITMWVALCNQINVPNDLENLS